MESNCAISGEAALAVLVMVPAQALATVDWKHKVTVSPAPTPVRDQRTSLPTTKPPWLMVPGRGDSWAGKGSLTTMGDWLATSAPMAARMAL